MFPAQFTFSGVPCVNTPPRPLPSVGLNTSEGKMGSQAPGQLPWEPWGTGKERTLTLPQVREGASLYLLLVSSLKHKVTEPDSSMRSEDTGGRGEDTPSGGCRGFGIRLRSSWYFSSFSNQSRCHCRLQPLLTTGSLRRVWGMCHPCLCLLPALLILSAFMSSLLYTPLIEHKNII